MGGWVGGWVNRGGLVSGLVCVFSFSCCISGEEIQHDFSHVPHTSRCYRSSRTGTNPHIVQDNVHFTCGYKKKHKLTK